MAGKQSRGSRLMPWNWFRHEQEEGTEQDAHPILRLQREMDRLFEHSLQGGSKGWPDMSLLKPNLDISERDESYVISVEIPGVSKDDIQLTQQGDQLVIQGEKKQEHEEKTDKLHRIERSYGHFQRVLALPADADSGAIKADFKDGVLTVTVPRKAGDGDNGRSIGING
ncbi:Hsp20/alpha crystallin family protein [Oceanimonas sp. CHS3-5]|uniref:Hsp20/alpha crystallin family protein n=1 Tax=Oceanimonas sp. CHS3-5 TaxID=3068186 RepID=UPI00273D931F|nr:Hsp20/alpha crystallin family protein [Oceanimonas sp. CHS3-5]MDP5291306.1 Hsp20/alpha crystallin family protein [Oceanimonas sp. CHS3-5]